MVDYRPKDRGRPLRYFTANEPNAFANVNIAKHGEFEHGIAKHGIAKHGEFEHGTVEHGEFD
jgi:hypothetical protein